MASYHISVKTLSRSSGRSAVAAAAYRSRSEIKDLRQGLSFDYSNKKDLGHSEILAPENSPEWVYDRSELWNRLEAKENRKDSQLMREIEVALPRELTSEEQVDLLRNYCNDNFVKHGMIADTNIHQDKNNPHAHVMLTMRKVKGESFGRKIRSWNSKSRLMKWREEWANVQNLHLAKAGHDIQVDHRSYADQGIDIEPQIKRGVTFHDENTELDRVEKYNQIAFDNGQRIIETPEIAFDHLTKYQSTFTHDNMLNYVRSHSHESQFDEALKAVSNSSEMIIIKENDFDKFTKFTTKSFLDLENKMLTAAHRMAKDHVQIVEPKYIKQASVNCSLSPEQSKVLSQTIEGGSVHAIVGHAGTGKSYTLNAIREAYEFQGYKMQGVSLAGVAAEGLENSSGIQSTTIAKKFSDWDNDINKLDSKSILVVDEAGMVGTRQTQRILEETEQAGAKVIFVGDTKQTQAIEAGGAFRGIIDQVDASRLTEVWRQKDEWQKETIKLLSGNRNDISNAIDTFNSYGNVHAHKEYKHASSKMLMDYVRNFNKENTSVMIAHTNDDVSRLNIVCRDNLKRSGVLGEKEIKVKTSTGVKAFTAGDRVLFLRNEKSIGVKNGTFGTVGKINKAGNMMVSLDNNKKVIVDTEQYNNINYGYAATVHKLQGATIDKSYVLASEGFDRHLGYVAMSRHRDQMNLYYSRDKFQNYEDLKRQFGNLGEKELLVDYHKNKDFLKEELDRFTDKNATFTEKEFSEAPDYIKNHIEAVGFDEKGKLRYTTTDMLKVESELFKSAQNLTNDTNHNIDKQSIDKSIRFNLLDDNQRFVVDRVAGGGGLSIVQYDPETDRKRVAFSLKKIYQDKGYVVDAVSLSGMGAHSFEKETGVSSKTVTQTLWEWENGKNKLNEKSVLMIDNANLIGTRPTNHLVQEAEKAGAKVIMFGDDQALQSIEAGGAYRGILYNTEADRVTLSRTDKKEISWQQQCHSLLKGDQKDAAKAIDIFTENGRIEKSNNPVKSVVDDWVNEVKKSGFTKNTMLSYTNKDVQKLNSGARAELEKAGFIDSLNETKISTDKHGEINIAGGDRIMFLRKDNQTGINSGSVGSVQKVDKDKLLVMLDGGKTVSVDTKLYNDINYGYASTVYRRPRGVENTYVLSSKHFNKHITQEALSNTKNVKMYHGEEKYDKARWILTRPADKDLAADYPMNSKAYRISVQLNDKSLPSERYVVIEPQINKEAEKKQLNRKALDFAKDKAKWGGVKIDNAKDITIKVESVSMEKFQEQAITWKNDQARKNPIKRG